MELFTDNIFIIYIIVGFSIFTMNSFEEYQRFILFYVVSFFAGIACIMRLWQISLLSLLIMFLMTEYFTDDKTKKNIILKLRYKVADFLYNALVMHRLILYFISLSFLFLSHIASAQWLKITLLILSAVTVFICVHFAAVRPFDVISLGELRKKLDEYLIYKIDFSPDMRKRFDILCELEDKTYFERENAYNFLTAEFIGIKIRRLLEFIKYNKSVKDIYNTGIEFVRNSIVVRGYSTLEMQLIRILSVKSKFNKHVIRRKIYELVYSTVFFSSLKDEFEKHVYPERNHFREYLLYVYCHNVTTVVNGQRQPMINYFGKEKDISKWEPEKMLIACVGLNGRAIRADNMYLFDDIIDKYNLSRKRLLELIG